MTAPDPRALLAALQDWAQKTLPAPPSGHGGPECQWCPLCQLASVLRGEHPELTDRLAEAGAAVSNAVRTLLDAAPSAPAPEPAPSDPAPPVKPQPRPRVQRIVLDDETPKD